MSEWNELLMLARRGVGLTQRDLAELVGVSESSIKSYELGRRKPTATGLHQMLDAMNADWRVRNQVISSIGLVPHLKALGGRSSVDRYLSLEEASDAIEQRPWPALVLNDRVELLALNRAGFALLPIDPDRLSRPVERNMLTMAVEPALASRNANWDALVTGTIALFKAHDRYAESLEHPSAYFSAVLAKVYEGDPRLVRRFIDLWDRTPGFFPPKVEWTYAVSWHVPEVGAIEMQAVVNSVNELDALDIDDWIPADAASFARIEKLLA